MSPAEVQVRTSNPLRQLLSRGRRRPKPPVAFPQFEADLVGKRFGKVTLISKSATRSTHWVGKCDCGKVREFLYHNLFHGKQRSCGCLQTASKYQEGMQFNGFTLVAKGSKANYWLVRCTQCLQTKERQLHQVTTGRSVCVWCRGPRKRRSVMPNDQDEIRFDERFEDGEGREWAVQAVNMKELTIRLRLVNPPERIISLEYLQSQFKLGGLRAMTENMAKKWEMDQQELRDKVLPKGPGER